MIMDRPKDKNRLDEALTDAIGAEDTKPDFEKWKKQHPQAVEMITSRARKKTTASPPNIWRIIMKSPVTKLATAAVIVVAVIISFNQFIGPTTNVALAEVTSRFTQIDYVHVYFFKSRGDTLFRQFEGWYAHGKLAMRGNKGYMTYDDGQTKQTFDDKGKLVSKEASFFAEGQTFIDKFTVGLLSEKNELLNQQMPTNVGDDFLIYEFDPPPGMEESERTESIAITVGRNSLLPVQLKFYYKDGNYDLIMFDYEAPEKLPEFFEHSADDDAPNGRGEVVLDGEEVTIDIDGAPGLKQAIVRLHSKYEKRGEPIFKLDVYFIIDEGYRSRTLDIALRLNETHQCGVGPENGYGDWPDGQRRQVRFNPLIKSTDREDTYIVEIRCWLRLEDN